ncbi:MAG: glycosyl hydrolase 108 family protein [Pseudomonadota bacterium]
MADFQSAIAKTLAHEGGFVDDPADAGGATNWGISLRFLRAEGDIGDVDGDGDIDANDVRQMTRAEAIEIYRVKFWERYHYADLAGSIGEKLFDLCVNMGPRQAHKILQRALRACGFVVDEDGIIGPNTIRAANETDGTLLLVALRAEAAGFYRSLIAQKPALQKFQNGWLNRAYS